MDSKTLHYFIPSIDYNWLILSDFSKNKRNEHLCNRLKLKYGLGQHPGSILRAFNFESKYSDVLPLLKCNDVQFILA